MLREGTYLKHGSQSRLGRMDLTLSIFNRNLCKKGLLCGLVAVEQVMTRICGGALYTRDTRMLNPRMNRDNRTR